jgi:DUF917 family protein/N-methylhydantoinase A/oxoprolinase/acetone carboxylase beta subunit
MANVGEQDLVIGVDVGGTNTDVAVMRGKAVLSQAKRLTSRDVTSGVVSAIEAAIGELESKNDLQKTRNVVERVSRVNIGTTHFINAVIQKKGLAKVSVVRVCGTASTALPPFTNFPADLSDVVKCSVHFVKGGYEFNANEIDSIDEEEIKTCFSALRDRGCRNVVICGVFSPVKSDQERLVVELAKSVHPEASYTLSHQVAHLGLLERENAAILNEALKPLSGLTISAFQDALKSLKLSCPLYLTQNDGTLISSALTREFPIFTFSSGATNSMRGAMWLSGLMNAIVVDIGGTSTDVGVLKDGFPREASTLREVGGVPTNFRLPDVPSIGVGGGSIVNILQEEGRKVTVEVGPLSVGSGLFERAKSFGGDVLTTTDVAMVAGVADLLPLATPPELSPSLVYRVMQEIHKKLETVIDKVKTEQEDVPVILVGGGSMLIDSSRQLKGVSQLIRPPHYDVANAVGAALGQVSGTVDHIVTIDREHPEESRAEKLKESKQLAIEAAVTAGADRSTVTIVEVTEVPVPYVGSTGVASRMKVKAVGDLRGDSYGEKVANKDIGTGRSVGEGKSQVIGDSPNWPFPSAHIESLDKEAGLSEPDVDHAKGLWTLSEHDIECLAIGAGILGCGGGGSPSIGKLLATQAVREGKQIQIKNPFRVAPGSKGRAVPVAFMGAPVILVEKLVNGSETSTALKAAQQLLSSGMYSVGGGEGKENRREIKVSPFTGQEGVWRAEGYQEVDTGNVPLHSSLDYLISAEIGGMNSIEPLLVGAKLGLPVLDADGMGRAFPELQMYLPFIEDSSPYPTCIADNKGEVVAVSHCTSAKALENVLRLETIRMGCSSGIVLGCLGVDEVLSKCVLLSMSGAWTLGRAVVRANMSKRPPYSAITESRNGRLLTTGKIIDLVRTTEGGFNHGRFVVEGFEEFVGKYLIVEFQNENLVAMTVDKPTKAKDKRPKEGDVTTPDLISVVDMETGYPVTTEDVQYGLRVAVVAMAADLKMKTKKALRVVGPRAFKYDFDYLNF